MRSSALVFLFGALAPLSAAASPQVNTTTSPTPTQSQISKAPPKIDPGLKKVIGIVATLNMVENRVLANPAVFEKNRKQIVDLTRRLAKLWLSGGPGCDAGYCQENGICIPCKPAREPKAFAIANTLNMIENRILLQFAVGSPLYEEKMEETGTQTRQMYAMMMPSECGCGYCLENGLCNPCMSCE